MKLRTLATAERDLSNIYDYIAVDSPRAAKAIVRRIRERASSLTVFPEQGVVVGAIRRLQVSGTPYVIYYRIRGDQVRILRIFHGRQRRP